MQSRAKSSLLGPTLGTILFVALVPGTIVGFVPYRLSGWRLAPPLLGWTATRWIGVGFLLLGLPLFVTFLGRFVREGHGTPAPVAAPMVIGQGLLFASKPILAYAAGLALAFHLFVVLYEEPTLRARFGEEYASYCRRVPRWIPRWRFEKGGA